MQTNINLRGVIQQGVEALFELAERSRQPVAGLCAAVGLIGVGAALQGEPMEPEQITYASSTDTVPVTTTADVLRLTPEATIILPPPTTITTETPTTVPPPQTLQAAAVPEIATLPERSYPARERLKALLPAVPTLQEITAQFAGSFPPYEQHLEFINQLDASIKVTPETYAEFAFSQEHVREFAHNEYYSTTIEAEFLTLHTTMVRYVDGLQGFLRGMNREGYSTAYFTGAVDPANNSHQLIEDESHMTAHGLGLNRISHGYEIEAGDHLDLTPEVLQEVVMGVVSICRKLGWEINETTVVGHYAADMIFVNKNFNPEAGTVASLRKKDMPQELVMVIIRHAQALDAQLGPRP